MQMRLPLFPKSCRLINSTTAVEQRDEMVYYHHSGSIIYCHEKNDLQGYRYITANLVVSGLCKPKEIGDVLGVSNRNIQRYAKALREKGSHWFFNREERRGRCHKMSEGVMDQAQKYLDGFYGVADTAKLLGLSESAIRYHLKNGRLKKKWR